MHVCEILCARVLMQHRIPCWDTKGIGKEIYGTTCYSCPVDCKGKSWVGHAGTCECFGCADSSAQCNEVELTSAQLQAIDDRVSIDDVEDSSMVKVDLLHHWSKDKN